MQKLRYEVDPHNRLVVSEPGRRLPITRFRRVFDGRFKLGPGNSLIYHIKGPMYGLGVERKAPHQLKLRGNWSLNKNHDLVLTLNKWRRQTVGDELTLAGKIAAATSNSIYFAVTTRSKQDIDARSILKLQGIWQADEQNRLTFRVEKAHGRHDILTFDGIWELTKQQRIVYRYEKAQLIRKSRLRKTLIFEGCWDISKRRRLFYTLSRDGKSAFEFQTGIAALKKNCIKCEIGIGVSNRKAPLKRILMLFGKWRIKKNLGLLFEVKYTKGRTKAIVFGADARLTRQDKVEFKLKNELGKDLGLELKLSRKLLKGDGEAFLKLLKDKKEATVYAGAGWRW